MMNPATTTAQRPASVACPDIDIAEEILSRAAARRRPGQTRPLILSEVMEQYKQVLRARGLDHIRDTKLYKLLLKLCMISSSNKEFDWRKRVSEMREVLDESKQK